MILTLKNSVTINQKLDATVALVLRLDFPQDAHIKNKEQFRVVLRELELV
jgi:hypothetical protein